MVWGEGGRGVKIGFKARALIPRSLVLRCQRMPVLIPAPLFQPGLEVLIGWCVTRDLIGGERDSPSCGDKQL